MILSVDNALETLDLAIGSALRQLYNFQRKQKRAPLRHHRDGIDILEKISAKPATIEDVAKLAGVSIATVSRALSKPDKVAETTRKKVNAAIGRTGYRANAMAQSLRMQRSKMVMVLAHSISDSNFPGILAGLEKVANARGYGLLIGSTEGKTDLVR